MNTASLYSNHTRVNLRSLVWRKRERLALAGAVAVIGAMVTGWPCIAVPCEDLPPALQFGYDDLFLYPEPQAANCSFSPGGGGPSTLRFYGRIVSDRTTLLGVEDLTSPIYEGVDTIHVEVWDRDAGGDELLWGGYTNQNGCFDSGIMLKVGESQPDIYLRVVAQNGAVRLEHRCFGTWAWQSNDDNSALFFNNFAGEELHFGAVRVDIPLLDARPWTLVHAFNVITRIERWLRLGSGLAIDLPQVTIRNPEYLTSFYDGRIVTSIGEEERDYLHHYAHFLQDQYGTVLPDDCDDTAPCVRPSHWCANQSAEEAWQEGFADWFPEIALARMAELYTVDGGTAWQPAGAEFSAIEHVAVCPDTGVLPAPLELSGGMFAAFLFDLTDGHLDPQWYLAQDDEKTLVHDNYSDCARSGWFEILDVATQSTLPMTPSQFVADYSDGFPTQRPALYWTAFNITPDYLATGLFPDAQAPGVVPDAGSRQVGSSPCIPLTVDPPADDGTGACGYSWEWTQNAAGLIPDFTLDVLGSCTLPGPVLVPGDWYVSLRAQDCANNWSSEYATFGPFEIRDCNSNGVTDACEVSCDEAFLIDGYDCNIPLNLCDAAPCAPNDCNGNLNPDDCDIAQGISADCNGDDVPDDCQKDTLKTWVGGIGIWNDPDNWTPDSSGVKGITDPDLDACVVNTTDVVTITNFAAKARQLHCDGQVIVQGINTVTSLELNDASVIRGSMTVDSSLSSVNAFDLTMSNADVLNGARLRGQFTVTGSLNVSGTGLVKLGTAILTSNPNQAGDLVIASGATVNAQTGFTHEVGDERIYVELAAKYNFSGDGVIDQGFGLFEIDGTLTRTSGNGEAGIFVDCINRGRIEIDSGDFKITGFQTPLQNSGVIEGQSGTTISLVGGSNFTPTSELSAGLLAFVPGGPTAPTTIRGQVDLKDGITVTSQTVIVDPSTVVISYGNRIEVAQGLLTLGPPLNAELSVDQIIIEGGNLNFDAADPIRTNTLVAGSFRYADPIVVEQSFTWNAAGQLRDSDVTTKGTTQLGVGGSVRALIESIWTNEGIITLDQSITLKSNSMMVNALGATIDISVAAFGGTLIDDQATLPTDEVYRVENDGLIIKSAAGTGTFVSASIWNRGDLVADLGTITFSNFLRQTAGRTILNGGGIVMFNPSRPFRLEGGLLGGTNTFTGRVENSGGSVQPAEQQIGSLTIDGVYIQSGQGDLAFQISGLNQSVTYDHLEVTGLADIQGGTLTIEMVNNYVPPPGTQFTIVTAGVAQGGFDQVTSNGVFNVAVGPTDVVLTFIQPGNLADLADFDNDNDVDLDDAQFLLDCINGPQQPVSPPCDQADLDGDGDVDLVDYQLLLQVFG